MLPDMATLYIAGATQEALNTNFWQDVYGFSMNAVADKILKNSQGKAIVGAVPALSIMTETVAVRNFDLCTMHPEDADFSSEFELPLLETVSLTYQELLQVCVLPGEHMPLFRTSALLIVIKAAGKYHCAPS